MSRKVKTKIWSHHSSFLCHWIDHNRTAFYLTARFILEGHIFYCAWYFSIIEFNAGLFSVNPEIPNKKK